MLLKNAQGHKPAPTSAAPAALAANNPANNPTALAALGSGGPATAASASTATTAGAAAATSPVAVGSGPVELVVTHGKARKLAALTPRPEPEPEPEPESEPLLRRVMCCGARRRPRCSRSSACCSRSAARQHGQACPLAAPELGSYASLGRAWRLDAPVGSHRFHCPGQHAAASGANASHYQNRRCHRF